MQIAVLIMMHKNPEQVLRLLRWYRTPKTVCFIHVDRKLQINISEFEKQAKRIKKEVVVSRERFSGVLHTWSLVEIPLHLAECARQYEKDNKMHFSYYQLLSGQDYPIGKHDAYIKLLEESYPAPFLNLCKRSDEEKFVRLERIRYSSPRCVIEDYGKIITIKRVLFALIHAWEVLITAIVGKPERKLRKQSIVAGFGAEWWILPDDIMEVALQCNRGEGETRLVKMADILRNTSTPDETFFQTVFLNSRFVERELKGNLTHCNFGGRGRVNTGHPYVLEVEDFDTLKYWAERNHFFARKFDASVDEKIMDMIDEQIYS